MTANLPAMLMVLFAATASERAPAVTAQGVEMMASVQPWTLPVRAGESAVFEVTLRNQSSIDQIVDLMTVRGIGASFRGGGHSRASGGEVQTDESNDGGPRCLDPAGLIVVKPGADATVFVKIMIPRDVFGSVAFTLDIGFWIVTSLKECTVKHIKAESMKINSLEIRK